MARGGAVANSSVAAPGGGHYAAAGSWSSGRRPQRKRAKSSKDIFSPTLHVKAPSVVGIFSQFGGEHRQSDNTTTSLNKTSPNMLR